MTDSVPAPTDASSETGTARDRSGSASDRPWRRVACVLLAVGLGVGIAYVPFGEPVPPAAARLLGVTLAMAVLWFTEALPLAVTSLVPLAAYPLLGILPSKETAAEYINTYTFLFFSGLVIAAVLERWNLHRRIALGVLRRAGTRPLGLCIGLMGTAALLSMWISNTATTMLMLPIGLAVLATLEEQIGRDDRLATALLLSIAYGANCGGMATPIGTPTNVTLLKLWEESADLTSQPVPTMGSWIAMAGPFVLIMLAVLAGYFALRLRGVKPAELSGDFFDRRARELGPMDGGSIAVAAIFVGTALLWMTRSPLTWGSVTISPGWQRPLEAGLNGLGFTIESGGVNDTVVGIVAVLLLFALPGKRRTAPPSQEASDRLPAATEWTRLIDWESVERRLPWGVLLLFGAGFAIAAGFTATGLDQWCGRVAGRTLAGTGTTVTTGGVVLLVTTLTEFTTNVGTLNTLLPVIRSLAQQLAIDPPRLMLPATLAASCAFMLPIATPPNAIIFGSGRLTLARMASAGLVLNLAAIALLTLLSSWLFG